MKLIIEDASYGERFEKDWKGDESFKAEHQLSVIASYLCQYKMDLQEKWKREINEVKKQVIMAKICDIEEILNDHKELFQFIHDSATAL